MRTQGLVLSGGGTKGAFEVGALRYLVGEEDHQPTVIAGTSAGSVLAAVLAQARGPEELAHRVDQLRADLLAMTRTDLVFGRQPWLAELAGTPAGEQVDAFLARTRPTPPPGTLLTTPRRPTTTAVATTACTTW